MKYFTRDEFECPCCGKEEMRESTLEMLDKAREIANTPFVINSAYRCDVHNPKVGGSPSSSHMIGWAVDIAARTSRQRSLIIKGLVGAGFTRYGVYKTFIHADNDPQKPADIVWLG